MSYSIPLRNKDTKTEQYNLDKIPIGKITEDLVHSFPKTIKHFFPNFKNSLRKTEDYRKRSDYELSAILMGAISLFIFKKGSRNAFNNERHSSSFLSNYKKLFSVSLPHMDTVDDVFRIISPEALEKFKVKMIRELLEKKVLHKWRLLGKYFIVAVDGTGVMSFNKRHCDKCLVSAC